MRTLAIACLLLILGGTGPVLAQESRTLRPAFCNTHDNALDFLAEQYSEKPVQFGVTNGGALLEVLTSPDGNTWTIILTDGKGQSCLIAAGEGWRPVIVPSGPRA